MDQATLLKRWVPALIWMGAIFVASTDLMSAEHTSRFIGPFLRWLNPGVSPATIATVQLAVRKVAHVTEYAVLAILLLQAWPRGVESRFFRTGFAVFAVCTCYAALDEFHQSFVASRTASAFDVLIDTGGALLGLAAYGVAASCLSPAGDRR